MHLKDFCSMILGTTEILCSIMFHWKRKFRERVDTPDTRCLLVSVLHKSNWFDKILKALLFKPFSWLKFATAAPPAVLALLLLLSWTAKLCVYFKLNCYKETTALGILFLWVIEGLHLPGTQMMSTFWRSTSKTRPFPSKTRVIWVPGGYRDYDMATLWESLWNNNTPQVFFFRGGDACPDPLTSRFPMFPTQWNQVGPLAPDFPRMVFLYTYIYPPAPT